MPMEIEDASPVIVTLYFDTFKWFELDLSAHWKTSANEDIFLLLNPLMNALPNSIQAFLDLF